MTIVTICSLNTGGRILNNLNTQMHHYLSDTPAASVHSVSATNVNSSTQSWRPLLEERNNKTTQRRLTVCFQTTTCSSMEDLLFKYSSFLGKRRMDNYIGIPALILSFSSRPSISSCLCSPMLTSPSFTGCWT